MSSFPDERHLDATAEGVAEAVAMLCPAPAEVASEATAPHRQGWLWPGRIPCGTATVLAGDPHGVSALALHLMAAVTRGWALPGQAQGCKGGAVMMVAPGEDPRELLRRLEAAGADPAEVTLLRASATPGGAELLSRALAALRPRLVVLALAPSGVDPAPAGLRVPTDAALLVMVAGGDVEPTHLARVRSALRVDLASLTGPDASQSRWRLVSLKQNLGKAAAVVEFDLQGDALAWRPAPAAGLMHRFFPRISLVGCGLTPSMAVAAGALREDPGAVTCRDCLLHGPYQQLHQAVAALERLGVAVGDPATAQARGLVSIIYSNLMTDGRPRLAWRIDPSAAELPAPPIGGDVRLVAEAQAALAGRPFTRMEARHLAEKMALARELGTPAEEAAVPREEEAEEAESLPAVPAPPPVHYSDWGRCLDERDDDVLSEDPKKVTCAECLRLMAEDAAEEG